MSAVGSVGNSSAHFQEVRASTDVKAAQVQAKAAEEASESPAQEANENGSISVRA